MLPTPEISVWSSSARLTSVRLRRSAADEPASAKAGSIGSRAMCAISAGSVGAALATTDSPPNVRWSTKRSSRPAVGEA